ncbi:hypothetical protein ACIPW5_33915 [Streptomyces sp. NPDC090077]|uniref:hypothetical protein n=1 Tax=Streptomyces sp. NPDC090077 TaxID=3365938 RepID=UPI00382C221E
MPDQNDRLFNDADALIDRTNENVVIKGRPAAARPSVTFFEDANYQGKSFEVPFERIPLPQRYPLPVSSVKLSPGLKVTLYDAAEGEGASLVVTGDTPDLGDFNNKTQSFRLAEADA